MDENNEALNETIEENNQVESPTNEQTPEETTEEASEGVETEGESRRSAQSRIRELNSQKKAAEEEARSLRDKLEELTSPVGLNEQQFNNVPQDNNIYADNGQVDPDKFRAQVLQEAEARADLKIRQSEAIGRINSEASEVLRDFPELDPKSESFNKDLSESITEATEAYVKGNPYSASVKKFVAKLMKPYKGAVEREVGQATENIAKQVSQAALRPTSVRKQEKAAGEKSIAELEAELGMVHS